MIFLIIILTTSVLLGSFLLLVRYETMYSVRALRVSRARLDARAARLGFILAHVDFSAFFGYLVRAGGERVLHDFAHGTLQLVRTVERILTRTVRSIRTRRVPAPKAPRESSPFAQSMGYIRQNLRKARRAPAAPVASAAPTETEPVISTP